MMQSLLPISTPRSGAVKSCIFMGIAPRQRSFCFWTLGAMMFCTLSVSSKATPQALSTESSNTGLTPVTLEAVASHTNSITSHVTFVDSAHWSEQSPKWWNKSLSYHIIHVRSRSVCKTWMACPNLYNICLSISVPIASSSHVVFWTVFLFAAMLQPSSQSCQSLGSHPGNTWNP